MPDQSPILPLTSTSVAAALASVDVRVDACTDSPENCGDQCQAEVSADVVVGCVEASVNGWWLCGWLARGATCDIDGSGLALWGDAQPGGWTACAGDGQSRGLPRCRADDADGLILEGGEGCGDEHLSLAAILALDPAALAVAIDGDDWDTGAVEEALEQLAQRVQDALDAAIKAPAEPSAEACWDALCGDDEDVVRVGSPWCGGDVVIVREQGDYTLYLAGDSWEDAVAQATIADVRRRLRELDGEQ